MTYAFALLLAAHAAVHLAGFVKAFGLAEVGAIHASISRPLGLLWLLAGAAHVATAVAMLAAARTWWMVGAFALICSQIAIVSAWSDAKLGTLVNVLFVVPIALAGLDARASSFHSVYARELERGLSQRVARPLVTDADLAPLPELVAKYLRRVGVVGRPRVNDVRVRWRGRMKSAKDAAWMDIRAEQAEFFAGPTRIFHLRASRWGVPFEALHVYAAGGATMRVRVASLVDVVDARGPEMNVSETVTLFNDMCLLAPASLLDANVAWAPLDERRVGATFSHAGDAIHAVLTFDGDGDLRDFWSEDRFQSSDGKTFVRHPWSTPVAEYREFHGLRLASRADAVWHEPAGEYVYAQFEMEDVECDGGERAAEAPVVSVPRARTVVR